MRKLFTPLLLGASSVLVLAQAPTPSDATPFDDAQQREAFISKMKSRIAINQRDRDPFGLPQTLEKGVLFPPEPEASFQEAISKIPISAIDARRGTFVVGAREVRTGEVFPLMHAGTRIRVRVQKVSPGAVLFRNLESGESATRRIKLDPLENIDWQQAPDWQGIERANPAGGRPIVIPS